MSKKVYTTAVLRKLDRMLEEIQEADGRELGRAQMIRGMVEQLMDLVPAATSGTPADERFAGIGYRKVSSPGTMACIAYRAKKNGRILEIRFYRTSSNGYAVTAYNDGCKCGLRAAEVLAVAQKLEELGAEEP